MINIVTQCFLKPNNPNQAKSTHLELAPMGYVLINRLINRFEVIVIFSYLNFECEFPQTFDCLFGSWYVHSY